MKKLNSLKKPISSFENKKLKDLQSIQGGKSFIRSNVDCGNGCVEWDVYSGDNGTGTYLGRRTMMVGAAEPSGDVN